MMTGSENRPYILVFDHGTTGVRACIINHHGTIVAQGYEKVPQIYPQPGWVEHDPTVLWNMTLKVAQEALRQLATDWSAVAAIGITNQRETVIVWDATTGKPVHNAIVWQCRRTSQWCDTLKASGHAPMLQEKTGLVVDPYFSASKIRWLFDHVPQINGLKSSGNLRFGTVDTWILWNLSGGACHVTDPTNASRTQLYNIHTRAWDPELLALFDLPREILPEVKGSGEVVGETDPRYTDGEKIPLAGIAGDQQAALFGQKCWAPGSAKSTYGTGAFLMMNLGDQSVTSRQGLLTTLGCKPDGQPCYAFEGAIFTAGATLEWIQQTLGFVQSPKEFDPLAQSLPDNQGVYLVPAFAGLGAPYWDPQARGAIFGLTQGTGKAHFVRAALEAMAYQTREVLEAMQEEGGLRLESLRVDGGVSRSNFLLQFLADMLAVPVIRTGNAESTTMGAAYLAGLAVGFWSSPQEIADLPESQERFEPAMAEHRRNELYAGWRQAISHVLTRQPETPSLLLK
jgi:glycerol kinase